MLVTVTGSMDLPRPARALRASFDCPIDVGARHGSWSARHTVRDARVERKASNQACERCSPTVPSTTFASRNSTCIGRVVAHRACRCDRTPIDAL